jgi:uncharacterized protein (TIGR00266 family)
MELEIQYRPAHALARVDLEEGETVIAEAGAMVAMSANMKIETRAGGLFKGLKRVFGGESFFRNRFTAEGGPGELLLAHGLCGDLIVLPMLEEGYYLQMSSYVASTSDVRVDEQVADFKPLFGNQRVFVRASGEPGGQMIVGAFGGIEKLRCEEGLVIDTGHVVAWEAGLSYTIEKSGRGWLSSLASGEGLVALFEGQGEIWIQTRNPLEFGDAMGAMLSPRR